MKKCMKEGFAIVTAFAMLFSFGGNTAIAATEPSVRLQCSILDQNQADTISDYLEYCIVNKYEGYYNFDDFRVIFHNEQYLDDIYSVDVDVITDMTLIRNPEDSAVVSGMKQEVQRLATTRQNNMAQNVLDNYLDEVSEYYNKPVETGFLFRINIAAATVDGVNTATEFDSFHRVDAEDGVILTPASQNEVFTEIGTKEDGKNLLSAEIAVLENRSVSYDKDEAVSYAVDNATAEPEFSSANGLGSDCANFVSKCINAGGIPVDNPGKWYPAPSPGSYAGENWMRTGYNKNGGVVPYMTDKGYFTSTTSGSATLGSILYWNNKSHVALVTQIDGYTIKYSQHSSSAQSSTYFTYDSSQNITFYKPVI